MRRFILIILGVCTLFLFQKLAAQNCIPINSYYSQTFELGLNGWQVDSLTSPIHTWVVGDPANKNILNSAHQGTNCVMTGGLTGGYANGEKSYLKSPCFDFTNLSTPYLSFYIRAHLPPDTVAGLNVWVSLDSSATWSLIGSTADTGWYNTADIQAEPGHINPATGPVPGFSANPRNGRLGNTVTPWSLMGIALPHLAGEEDVTFRFQFAGMTNPVGNTVYEGIAIDDIFIGHSPNITEADTLRMCQGMQMQLEVPFLPNATYRWTLPNNTTLSQRVINADMPGTYHCLIVGLQGSRDSADIHLLVENPLQQGSLGNFLPNDTICQGDTAYFSTPQDHVYYAWYGPNNNFIENRRYEAGVPDPSAYKSVVPGLQTVYVSDGNSCSIAYTGTIYSIAFNPTVSTTPDFGFADGQVFSDGAMGNGPLLFDWDSTGSFTAIDTLTGLSAGSYHVMVQNPQLCTRRVNYSILHQVVVFPGDANHDQLVDMKDLLPLGIHYSVIGPQRPNSSISWTPQPAPLWNIPQANGRDLRHVDTDGSGLISQPDTQAILQNFAITGHSTYNPPQLGPLLSLQMPTGTHQAGDTLTIPVHIGDAATPILNLYGLALAIQYDSTLVKKGSLKVDFANSWFGQKNTDMLSLGHDAYLEEQLDVGVVGTDSLPRSGFGRLFDIIVVVEDHIAKQEIPFELSFIGGYAIDLAGTEIPISLGAIDTTMLEVTMPLALAVEYFTGEVNGEQIRLDWATRIEDEVAYYEIEKYEVGKGTFIQIGKVGANGNIYPYQPYHFIDPNPHLGTNLYRLVKVAANGQADIIGNYLPILYQKGPNSLELLNIFPNPTDHSTEMKFYSKTSGTIQLDLFDLSGKCMTEQMVFVQAGENRVSISLHNLKRGVYLYRLELEGYAIRGKLIKQ